MKVALYARVSTEEKAELQDPEKQISMLKAYCEAMEHEVVAQFIDHASGKDPNRPAFNEIMKIVNSKRGRPWDGVVILRVDRFMRSALYGLTTTEEFKNSKPTPCALIFVRDMVDTSTPQGQLFYTLQLAFAECERGMISKRVSEGIREHIKGGGKWGKGRRKDVNVGLAVELLRSGKARNVSEAARQLGIPRGTLLDHAKRQKVDLQAVGLPIPSDAGGSLCIPVGSAVDGLRGLKPTETTEVDGQKSRPLPIAREGGST